MRYLNQTFLVILLVFFISCQFSDQEEFQIGEDFIDSNSGIVRIDTMDYYVSTVVTDSFSTSSSTRLLIGGWQNGYTGKVSCTPYFELTSGTFTIDDDDLVYDSIVMVMNYDQYYIGDTTKTMTVNIHRLTEEMELNDEDYLSNNARFAMEAQPLGQLTFKPGPNSGEEIMARIDHRFGERLFNMIIDKNDTLTNSIYFSEFFKGVALVPENTPGVMVGLKNDSTSTAPGFRIYYHEEVMEEEETEKSYFTIPYSTDGIHFNHFDKDLGGSLIAGIGDNKNELASSQISEKAIVQSGTGIFTKIRIPGIQDIPGIAEKVAFISATLKLIPLEGSYDKNNPLPETLSVYIADRKNNITGTLANSEGTEISATKVTDGEFDNLPYYLVDVTAFFNSLIEEESDKVEYLFIGPTSKSMANSAQSVIFGRSNKLVKPVDLEVYCYIDKN